MGEENAEAKDEEKDEEKEEGEESNYLQQHLSLFHSSSFLFASATQ